jgi:DNA-binding HxlR family transcriptional regulator
MATRRSYGDPCGIARALDVVGERWALLVVRELVLGPKRFTDLRAGLPGLSADILAQRLRELEAAGVLRRATLAPPAASKVYELTDRGRELEPILLALGRWGSARPFPVPRRALGVDAFVVALSTLFDAAAADGLELTIALRLDGDEISARVHDGRLDVARERAERPDAVIEAGPADLAQVLWHGVSAADGDVRIEGDRRAARRFLGLFPAPRTAAA